MFRGHYALLTDRFSYNILVYLFIFQKNEATYFTSRLKYALVVLTFCGSLRLCHENTRNPLLTLEK